MGKIENGRRKNWQHKERTFFFFFCFSLFKMTKISVGSTKMEIFYREKNKKNFPVMPLLEEGMLQLIQQELPCNAVTAEYYQHTLTVTPTYSSHSRAKSYEPYVAGQKNLDE